MTSMMLTRTQISSCFGKKLNDEYDAIKFMLLGRKLMMSMMLTRKQISSCFSEENE